MDGKGRCLDHIFIKRLWRSLKYGCVYLHAWVLEYRLHTCSAPFVAPYPSHNLSDGPPNRQVLQVGRRGNAPTHVELAGLAAGTWKRCEMQRVVRSQNLDQIRGPVMHLSPAKRTTHRDQHAGASAVREALCPEGIGGWTRHWHEREHTKNICRQAIAKMPH